MNSAALEKNAPLILIGLLVVGAIFLYATAKTTQGTQVIPGTDNSAAQLQAAQLNAQMAQQSQAQILGGFGSLVDYAKTMDSNATQLGEAQFATIAQIEQYRQQEAAIAAQASAQQQIAQAQAHASQQNAFWGGLFGVAKAAIPYG